MLSFQKGKDADTVTIEVTVSDRAWHDASELRKITSKVASEVREFYGDVKTSVTFKRYPGKANREPSYTVPMPSRAEQNEIQATMPVSAPPTGIGGSFANVLSVV